MAKKKKEKERYQKACAKFQRYLISHKPMDIQQQFRTNFFNYMSLTHESGFPEDFELFLGQMNDFFEILDVALEEEYSIGN